MVAVDKVFRTMEQTHPDGQLLMLSGFLPYGYDVKSAASAIVNRKTISDLNGLGQFQAGKTWVARWGSVLDGRLSVELAATGCAASLFDVMFPCGPAEGAVLMRYLGQSIPELGEAEQLEKSGNGIAARQVLETYLQKEPGNHGAAWQLGLLYYRQGEFDKMDQLYERRLAPFFPNHVSVLYNWGLAKQGVKQFAAASQLFERARALAPKDYAIGYNLADSYYRQDKKSRALATIDELLKLYPDNESLKRSREAWKIGANPNAKL
jgi:tetratricopeptide (TPR) repeat protein